MPNEVFRLTTVTRPLGENVELAEVLGFPELSALDDAERKWRATLQAKAKAILEDADASPPLCPTQPARRPIDPRSNGYIVCTSVIFRQWPGGVAAQSPPVSGRASFVWFSEPDRWIPLRRSFDTSNLPKGWQSVRIGDVVCSLRAGQMKGKTRAIIPSNVFKFALDIVFG